MPSSNTIFDTISVLFGLTILADPKIALLGIVLGDLSGGPLEGTVTQVLYIVRQLIDTYRVWEIFPRMGQCSNGNFAKREIYLLAQMMSLGICKYVGRLHHLCGCGGLPQSIGQREQKESVCVGACVRAYTFSHAARSTVMFLCLLWSVTKDSGR